MSFAQQPDIGSVYQGMKQEELVERIAARKKELADELLILSHHYKFLFINENTYDHIPGFSILINHNYIPYKNILHISYQFLCRTQNRNQY